MKRLLNEFGPAPGSLQQPKLLRDEPGQENMSNLKTLLLDLQTQLGEALRETPEPPSSGPRLRATRATLNLKLGLSASTSSPERLEVELLPLPGKAQGTSAPLGLSEHTLTIEFQIDPPGMPSAGAVIPRFTDPLPQQAPAASDTHPQEPASEEQPLTVLATALGAPGFDSSARATVFCEALEDLDEAQRLAIWGCLADTSPGTVIDPALKRARHLLRGVLRSGSTTGKPGGSTAAIAALFARHQSNELLKLVRTHWKSQEDWL